MRRWSLLAAVLSGIFWGVGLTGCAREAANVIEGADSEYLGMKAVKKESEAAGKSGASDAKADPKTPDAAKDLPRILFPHTPGTKWLSVGSVGNEQVVIETAVVGPKTVGTVAGTLFEGRIDKSVIVQDVYAIDDTGIFRVATGRQAEVVFSPPLPVFRFPLNLGDTGATYEWQGQLVLGKKTVNATGVVRVAGPDGIKVVNKEYRAYRVDLMVTADTAQGKVNIPYTAWFVPGIGPVRQFFAVNSRVIGLEMAEYKPK